MSEPKFVHLRVHTAYSLSEGAMQVPALIHKCHAQGIAAIAVTDTANMFGGKARKKGSSRLWAASSICAILMPMTC